MPSNLVNTKNTRLARIQAYFELTVFDLVQREAAACGMSTSNYIRGAVINQLVEKGKLDKDEVVRLLVSA